MVLIYSKDVDEFVNKVIDHLKSQFIRIGDRDVISLENLVINQSDELEIKGEYFKRTSFKEIITVWYNGGRLNSGNNIYENECLEVIAKGWLTSSRVEILGQINGDLETNKLQVLMKAKKIGFDVPETLVTGKKESLTDFFNKYSTGEGVVCKRILDRHLYRNKEHLYQFSSTIEVDEMFIDELDETFAISLFQQRINAQFEVRVVYVLGKIFSMSIHDFNSGVDHRANLHKYDTLRMVPFKLPDYLEEMVKELFLDIGLNYGCVDMMFGADKFYFLEINPFGQIDYLNEACNYHIDEYVAKSLENGIKRPC